MVKEKINSVRTYDEDGYRRRAACLCFKDESEQEYLEQCDSGELFRAMLALMLNFVQTDHIPVVATIILLVSSSKHKDKWVVPGGGIEPLEEPTLAAVREALEEAGAKGQLGRKIGDFENTEKKHRTTLYAFTVTDLLDEWEDGQIMGRRRQWFSIVEAKDHLAHKPVQVTYLDVLPKDLNGVVKR